MFAFEDGGLSPDNTFLQWKQDFDNYAVSNRRAFENLGELGSIESENDFADVLASAASGYNQTLEALDIFKPGLIPTAQNHGGLATQLPAWLLGDTITYRARGRLVEDAEGRLVIDPSTIEIIGEVDRPEDGDHIFVNGILTDVDGAVAYGAMQTGAVEFVLAHNPSHGFFGDAIETGWDIHFGGLMASGNARQLNRFYRAGIAENHSFSLAGHSQGVALVYRSMEGLDFTAGGTIKPGTVLASGGPVKATRFLGVARDAGFRVTDSGDRDNQAFFQVNEYADRTTILDTSVVDPVSDMPLLGNNYDRAQSNAGWGSVLSLGHLGGDDNPHASYLCWGVTCADHERGSEQSAMEAFRSGARRPVFIEPDGRRTRLR
jgi:filamentous hemagglutinin